MRHAAVIAMLLLTGALAACRSTPEAHFYTLSSGAPIESAAAAEAAYSVVVGPATVPDSVDRPQLVVRLSGNEVMLAEQARWAEPLKTAIPRVIAGDLSQLLNDAYVAAYPQNTQGRPDYRVLLDVQRFDAVLGDAVTLELLWTVRSAPGDAQKTGRLRAREAVAAPGYGALVAAHERALAAASRGIAESIRSMRP